MNFENYEDFYFSRKLLSFLVKGLREDPITTIQQLERWNDFRAMMVDRLLRQNPAIWEAFNNWISGELMELPSKN